jgi:hypothetical protein
MLSRARIRLFPAAARGLLSNSESSRIRSDLSSPDRSPQLRRIVTSRCDRSPDTRARELESTHTLMHGLERVSIGMSRAFPIFFPGDILEIRRHWISRNVPTRRPAVPRMRKNAIFGSSLLTHARCHASMCVMRRWLRCGSGRWNDPPFDEVGRTAEPFSAECFPIRG